MLVKIRRTNVDIMLSTLSFIKGKLFCKSQQYNRLVPLNENLLDMWGGGRKQIYSALTPVAIFLIQSNEWLTRNCRYLKLYPRSLEISIVVLFLDNSKS